MVYKTVDVAKIKKRGSIVMKRILILILFALVTLSFAGCDDASSDTSTGSMTLSVTYTNGNVIPVKASGPTEGTKKVYVYLYKALTLNANETTSKPDYQVCTDAVVASGTPEELVLDDIETGDYYVVVIYDAFEQTGVIAGEGDYYAIYSAISKVSIPNTTDVTSYATKVTVSEGANVDLTIRFGTDFVLKAGGAYNQLVAE